MARKPKEEEAVVEEGFGNPEEYAIIEFDENLSDMDDPVLLPEGPYLADLQEVTPTENQAGTGMYYNQKFVIPTEEYPADYDIDNAPEGTPLYYRMVSVPRSGDRRAVARIKRYMQTIGLSIDTNRIDVGEWVGRQAKLIIHHTKGRDGDWYAEIKSITSADA